MSKHTTYRGLTLDMDSIRRENEKTSAIGNMRVNAKGDQIKGGLVTKTADEIARENHRVQTKVINAGLKGKMPSATGAVDILQAPAVTASPKAGKTKSKEIELPSGDIIIDDNA